MSRLTRLHAPQVREADYGRFVQYALVPARDARALGPIHAFNQLLHHAPPGHGGFKFRARRLHPLRVKCDFGVLGVGELSEVPLVLIERLKPGRIDARAGRERCARQHRAVVLFELAALTPERGMFLADNRQRLAPNLLLAFPHVEQRRVTFG